jgi:Uma2 family endonuclease
MERLFGHEPLAVSAAGVTLASGANVAQAKGGIAMVSALTPVKRCTVDDLDQFPADGKRRELVGGQIVEWDVTTLLHSAVLLALGSLLRGFVSARGLGLAVGGDPLVRIQGSEFDARGPDVAFYARERIPHDLRASTTDVAPDFVIEVLSPSDRAGEVERKIEDWLRAGVRLLWYVNPETGTTMVYSDLSVVRVGPQGTLDGANVVPGFQVRIQDLLDDLTALTSTSS